MLKMQPLLNTAGKKLFITIMILSVFSGLLIRLILPLQTAGDPAWSDSTGHFPLLTPDSARAGIQADRLLAGKNAPEAKLPAKILFFLHRFFNIPVNRLLYLLPVLLAPLFVIPLLLIGRELHTGPLLYIAAFSALAVPAYYLRSHAGYYDTDLLNTFFPLLLCWSMLLVSRSEKSSALLPGGLALLLYPLWYHAAATLLYAQLGLFFLYTLLFQRHRQQNYRALFCWSIILLPLPWLLKLLLSGGAYLLLIRFPIPVRIWWSASLLAGSGLLLFTGQIPLLLHRLQIYLFQSDFLSINGYRFIPVMKTVSEAGNYSGNSFSFAVSAGLPFLLISLAGFFVLFRQDRRSLLLLPILGLGLSALFAGDRFAFYAAHLLPLGIAAALQTIIKATPLRFRTAAFSTALILLLIQGYAAVSAIPTANRSKITPVFSPAQAAGFRELRKKSSSKDRIICWWDIGWPLHYLTGIQPLTDNGRNRFDTFPVARLFTATNLLRARQEAKLLTALHRSNPRQPALLTAMQRWQKLPSEIEPLPDPKSNNGRDLLILTRQQLPVFYQIYRIGNSNPRTGHDAPPLFWLYGRITGRTAKQLKASVKLRLSDNSVEEVSVRFDLNRAELLLNRTRLRIKRVVKRERVVNPQTVQLQKHGLTIIVDRHTVAVMDERIYRSLFVQLYYLNKGDQHGFTPLLRSRESAVFRIK